MADALPKEESPGISEEVKRVAGGLALWMRVVAIMGFLGVLYQWGRMLPQAKFASASEFVFAVISGLIECFALFYLWQSAGSFRRLARVEQSDGRPLEHALRQLKTYFCFATILTVIEFAAFFWLTRWVGAGTR
ncbi:MAG: hypothetical protein ABSA67_11725 [Candidatus Brocadiia bacterium]|jgi:hypothetical protein